MLAAGEEFPVPHPNPVTLVPHDSCWAALARDEVERLCRAAGSAILHIHHIGSTSIPGIAAKPVLDLLGVVRSLTVLDAAQQRMEALGYACRGEYGLAGRRYFTLNDSGTGARLVQLHCYAHGDPAIARHLAFRDHLRGNADLATHYEREKARCAAIHPYDGHAYTACKSAWIKRVEAEALAAYRAL